MRTGILPKVLLASTAVFFMSTVILGAYLISHYSRMKLVEANLLTRAQMEKRILEKRPLDECLKSHMSSEISNVLDPARERCTLWVQPVGQEYRINSIGLRGDEIEPKRSGVNRVVILGDSWAFGWLLHDDDKLAAQLQRRVDAVSPGKFEFVTVAIPGWNTRSQAGFLRAHRELLDPDFLIWLVSQNDINDSMGVVAPGIGSIRLSPQAVDRAPMMHLSRHSKWPDMFWYSTTPMSFVADRWHHNFDLIRSMQELHEAPTLAIFAGLGPHYISFLERSRPTGFPVRFEPLVLDGDPRWKVLPRDGHPSPWAVGMQSLVILKGLADLGLPTGVELSAEEEDLAALWGTPGDQLPGKEAVDAWLEEYVAKVPERYRADDLDTDPPGAGVGDKGEMSDNGILYFRAPSGDFLEVDLTLAQEPRDRSVTFEVTAFGGSTSSKSFELQGRELNVRLPLPQRQSRFPLVEFHWQFDSMNCQAPLDCVSATLNRVEPAGAN